MLEPIPRRLEKLLVDDAGLSRRSARRAIAEGRVRLRVEGVAVEADAQRLVFPSDRVELEGARVEARAEHTTVLWHKPAGIVSTVRDPEGRTDLAPVLATLPPGCQPVGRLDRASTGALLFTTDGDLAHALRKPRHRVPKRYLLTLAGEVASADVARLRRGVETALGRLRAEEATVVERAPHATRLRVVLVGGKNRQLRRMCYRAGLRLRHLHREAFGAVELGAVPVGAWRLGRGEEVDALWASVGGRARIRGYQRQALVRQAAAARAEGRAHLRLERWLARAGRG